MPDQFIPPPPRFEWWRLWAAAVLIGLIFIGITALPRRHAHDLTTTLAMAGLGTSLIGFSAYRWHKIRVEIREGRFLLDEFRQNPQRYIRGPLAVVVIWFVCTLGGHVRNRCLFSSTQVAARV
jgi:hypothetical protein